MLTRIEIDGFKSFRDFALDIPPFLVIIGRNAAGKSNLFDAIQFLSPGRADPTRLPTDLTGVTPPRGSGPGAATRLETVPVRIAA
jgi:recombinational DNA repair ATPase RecF